MWIRFRINAGLADLQVRLNLISESRHRDQQTQINVLCTPIRIKLKQQFLLQKHNPVGFENQTFIKGITRSSHFDLFMRQENERKETTNKQIKSKEDFSVSVPYDVTKVPGDLVVGCVVIVAILIVEIQSGSKQVRFLPQPIGIHSVLIWSVCASLAELLHLIDANPIAVLACLEVIEVSPTAFILERTADPTVGIIVPPDSTKVELTNLCFHWIEADLV